ncbi:Pentatricopeptide repeat-containing protein, chloroplastic [Glycine soja]|uniref:Pentatricopeptide repeat-containing protein, chloroplastic n=1 Tax=Glycine soja TaxID=3848 RepID=A0A0B2SSN5_GLYSO|nr:Pentatricopeptide repeat-containing protein, chloroplastic [Glycine soja]
MVYKLPNEKEVVYGALDKRTTWETEFLVIAVSKALQILKKKVRCYIVAGEMSGGAVIIIGVAKTLS